MRDLALSEGVIEGIVDDLGGNAETRGLVAVDRDLELRRIRQQVGGDIRQLRHCPHFLQHLVRPLGQLADIGILQGVLKTGARDAAAHGDVLGRLHEERRSLDLGQLGSQSIDDLRGGQLALIARLEHDEAAPGVGGLRTTRGAGKHRAGCNVRILQNHVPHLAENLHHLVGGCIL